MDVNATPDIAAIAGQFQLGGELAAFEPFGPGHINDSYRLTCGRAGATTPYVLQRINTAIFTRPVQLMENVRRVTAHIASQLTATGVPEMHRCVLTLVPACDGADCHRDDVGSYWRVYRFIENTRTYEAPPTPEHAERAARAYGEFQRLLADLPPPRLHETIPDFHNTPLRYERFERAVADDTCGRVAEVRTEINFARQRRSLARVLLDLHRAGEIPERIVHNDAKLSNVMFDAATGAALCVVDLDTVMPGLSLYDFGDMVRSMVCAAGEDEPDLSRVEVDLPFFAALARGYLSSAGAFLTTAERAHLVAAGKLITYEQALRFLTDYLCGDTYYRTHRPDQNLDRTRVQFKLLESIERHEGEMQQLVRGTQGTRI